MHIISVNVGRPRDVEWNGGVVSTGIYKEPIQGPVNVGTLNLEGDRQADLTVHGGRSKAVYVYPSEHYRFWREELPQAPLPWGMFGENLSTLHDLWPTVHEIVDGEIVSAATIRAEVDGFHVLGMEHLIGDRVMQDLSSFEIGRPDLDHADPPWLGEFWDVDNGAPPDVLMHRRHRPIP